MPDLDRKTIAEVIAALSTEKKRFISDLAEDHPLAVSGKACGDIFTAFVDILRNFDHPQIRGLMSYVWDIFHNRHALLALGPSVKTLSVTALVGGSGPKILIVPPQAWPEMVKDNATLQLGGVLYVGSQVADLYNGLGSTKTEQDDTVLRATSYESEYLLIVRSFGYQDFTEYQKGVLARCPLGLNKSLLYTRKPVVITS